MQRLFISAIMTFAPIDQIMLRLKGTFENFFSTEQILIPMNSTGMKLLGKVLNQK